MGQNMIFNNFRKIPNFRNFRKSLGGGIGREASLIAVIGRSWCWCWMELLLDMIGDPRPRGSAHGNLGDRSVT